MLLYSYLSRFLIAGLPLANLHQDGEDSMRQAGRRLIALLQLLPDPFLDGAVPSGVIALAIQTNSHCRILDIYIG